MRKLSTVLVFVIFAACTREECNIVSSERGLVVTGVNVSACFPDTKVKKQWIIQRQGQWDSLFTGAMNTNCFKPSIDFSQFTILGQYAEGGGCQTAYHREVTYDSTQKKYTYTVRVENCGSCDLASYSYNFVSVPKISDSTQVVFETR